MSLFVKILAVSIAVVFIPVGFLMLFTPGKYPNLCAGFLNGRIMQRETTEKGRLLAIRTQGLVYLTVGAFSAFFVWAVR